MNLFVTFKIQPQPHPISHVDENPLPFTTPNQPIKRTHSLYSSSARRHPSTAGSQIEGFSLFNDDDLNLSQGCLPVHPQNSPHVQPQTSPPVRPQSYPQSCPPVHRPTTVSQIPGSSLSTDDNLDQEFPVVGNSGPSKTNRFSLLDKTLFCQDELLEKMFKEDPDNISDSWATDEDEDTASDASLPADIDGVQTRGYDQDFWAPLIGNPLGGSDAAEVMAGIAVPKNAPHIIHCTQLVTLLSTLSLSPANYHHTAKQKLVHHRYPYILVVVHPYILVVVHPYILELVSPYILEVVHP
ncbi:hypothetical protein Bca4012_052466 [Brassica carinata]